MSPRIFRSPFSGWNFPKDKFWSEQEIRTGENFLGDKKYAYINRLNTKIRSTMLCLSGFKLYSRWVPLFNQQPEKTVDISRLHHWFLFPAKWPLRNEPKVPYCWHATSQICVLLLIGWSNSRANQWWRRKMSAVFSGYPTSLALSLKIIERFSYVLKKWFR